MSSKAIYVGNLHPRRTSSHDWDEGYKSAIKTAAKELRLAGARLEVYRIWHNNRKWRAATVHAVFAND